MVIRFGSVPAKQHVTVIVNGADLDARTAQQRIGISSRRAPHGVESYPQVSFADHAEIHDLTRTLQIGGPGVERLFDRSALAAHGGATCWLPRLVARRNFRFNSFCNLRQGWTTVGRRELDSVVFR